MFVGAAPSSAHETDCVTVVDHHQSPILVREVTNRFQIRNGSIHRKYPVGRDHLEPGSRPIGLLKPAFQLGHVAVAIAEPLCFREPNAIDDGGVIQFIADHSILFRKQRLENTGVRVKTGRVQNRVFRSQKCTKPRFKFPVDLLRTTDETHRGKAVAPSIKGRMRRGDDGRMIRKPEIVIGAEIQDRAAISGFDPGVLRSGNNAFTLQQTGGFDAAERLLQMIEECGSHDSVTQNPEHEDFIEANGLMNEKLMLFTS